jgi:agmatine deiminase
MAGIESPQFHMPAEWEPHEGTWLAWPHEPSDWPGKFGVIPWVYCEIVRHLSRVEKVHILCPRAQLRPIRSMLERSGAHLPSVELIPCPTNRSWTRDYGPIFVWNQRGRLTALDWKFNAWAKYDDWELDDAVAAKIARRLQVPRVAPSWRGRRIVLEGGAIDVNGKGTLLATEECLLGEQQQRNPGLSRQEWEQIFYQYLGADCVIWLKRGIAGDDTHGHIDDIARFAGPRTVMAARERKREDVNYQPLRQNWRLLQRASDQSGRPLELVELPMPEPVYFAGQRLPASYANFYLANQSVLVPVFNDPMDRVALDIFERLFPQRTVIPIYCRDLVLGLGALHCMTQQQPAA